MTTKARFDLTMDAEEKDLVARAVVLMGATMAGFVRAAAKEKALTLLDRESRVTLSKRDFTAFAKALNAAFTPNQPCAQGGADRSPGQSAACLKSTRSTPNAMTGPASVAAFPNWTTTFSGSPPSIAARV